MHADELKGKWTQFVGEVKRRWGKLTDDDLAVVAGDRDKLVGRLQERYGVEKDDAEREVNDFIEKL
ncbi:general stress protein CsbD [Marinicauda salina]|uniref:General stress protein CsbD n=1 Tax=Marinicauda salina TaxID=2135793 RepID=A0A2U2BQX1_9PROT|nr:CsbD family protein [Marinicauda salina]PWE16403.1 general stress protein CsbD [Marinicauda salina]